MAEIKITLVDEEDGSVRFFIENPTFDPANLTPAQHMAEIMLDSLRDNDSIEED